MTVAAPDSLRLELDVAGLLRAETMSTPIAGSERLAVNAEDLNAVAEHTGTWEQLISVQVQDRARHLAHDPETTQGHLGYSRPAEIGSAGS